MCRSHRELLVVLSHQQTRRPRQLKFKNNEVWLPVWCLVAACSRPQNATLRRRENKLSHSAVQSNATVRELADQSRRSSREKRIKACSPPPPNQERQSFLVQIKCTFQTKPLCFFAIIRRISPHCGFGVSGGKELRWKTPLNNPPHPHPSTPPFQLKETDQIYGSK